MEQVKEEVYLVEAQDVEEKLFERMNVVQERITKLLNGKKKVILIGIDGRCGSGKSTLAEYLKIQFDCNLFHMDDFFLQMFQRSEERLQEAGGNVDYERFFEEVLRKARDGEDIEYRRFSCQTGEMGRHTRISHKRLNIVEGTYSMHPYFFKQLGEDRIYDLTVFCTVNKDLQKRIICKRNGEEKFKMFMGKWVPMEEYYFKTFSIKEKSDIILPWKELPEQRS